MKKVVNFCKLYLREMLFALLTLSLIFSFTLCWQQLSGFAIGLCGFGSVVAEMCIAFLLSYVPLGYSKSLKITHYLCFIFLAVTFIISILFSKTNDKELLILLALSTVAFGALFSDFAIVSYKAKTETMEHPIIKDDACDD